MTENHPITPPPEMVQQWVTEANEYIEQEEYAFANFAAKWGADQELEACINFVYDNELCDPDFYKDLRAARRPKPPSLKEQALMGLSRIESTGEFFSDGMKDLATIRRALEQLND
jgi:hypothetical protein